MSDASKEKVALELMQIIAKVEGKGLTAPEGKDDNAPGQQWIFKTYAKCMDLVTNPEKYMPASTASAKPAASPPKQPTSAKPASR